MRKCLAFIENMQRGDELRWAVFQNYKNLNTEAPLVRSYVRNVYNRISDTLEWSVISRFLFIFLKIH